MKFRAFSRQHQKNFIGKVNGKFDDFLSPLFHKISIGETRQISVKISLRNIYYISIPNHKLKTQGEKKMLDAGDP